MDTDADAECDKCGAVLEEIEDMHLSGNDMLCNKCFFKRITFKAIIATPAIFLSMLIIGFAIKGIMSIF